MAAGAEVVVGGGPSPQHSPLHYQPTILTNLTPDMTVMQEEVFGPVVSICQFSTEQQALAIANNCRTGLAGYFYSQDVSQCWRVARKMQTGAIKLLKMSL